jgi:Tfp pilus assembly protein PilV
MRGDAHRFRDESGFTLIELLVAAVILILGVFGLVASVNTSHKLSDVSEHETAASQVADRELELALSIPYGAVALTSLPATSATIDDTTQWNGWLSSVVPHPATSFNCGSASSVNNNPTLPNDERSTSCVASCPVANAATGCPAAGRMAPISTVSVPTTSGTVMKLKVYRFVTWVNDLACGTGCPNPAQSAYRGDYKRVTIAVLPVQRSVSATTGLSSAQALGGPTKPIVVSAIRNDPTAGRPNDESPCSVGGIQC